MDVELRVISHPSMIQTRVVRHEVEQEPHAAVAKSLPNSRQRRLVAEIRIQRVILDGERRSVDIRVREVGKDFLVVPSASRVGHCNLTTERPGLPNAEQPDPVKAAARDPIEVRVLNVVKRCPSPEPLAELVEADPRRNLVERRE